MMLGDCGETSTTESSDTDSHSKDPPVVHSRIACASRGCSVELSFATSCSLEGCSVNPSFVTFCTLRGHSVNLWIAVTPCTLEGCSVGLSFRAFFGSLLFSEGLSVSLPPL